MRIFDESWESKNFSQFVNNGATIDSATPIRGTASATWSCAGTNYFEKTFPYQFVNLYGAQRIKFSSFAVPVGVVQFWNATVPVIDFRINAAGHLEMYRAGVLLLTGNRILVAGNEYHFQFHITYAGDVGRVEVKWDDSNILDMNYLGNTGSSGLLNKIRYGAFISGGTATGFMDDIALNDGNNFTGGDYDWVGLETSIAVAPTNDQEFTQWTPTAGTHVSNLDEIPSDGDTTVVSTLLRNRRDSYSFAAFTFPNKSVIHAIKYEIEVKAASVAVGQKARVQIGFLDPVGTPVTEVEVISFSAVLTGGFWQWSWRGETTTPLQWNYTAAQIQAAINALRHVGLTGVAVTGSVGGPFTITFQNHMTKTQVKNVVLGNALTPTVTITLTRSATGKGIWYGDGTLLAVSDHPADILTDPYNESAINNGWFAVGSAAYEKRCARRRLNPANAGAWTGATANAAQIVLRSDPPLA